MQGTVRQQGQAAPRISIREAIFREMGSDLRKAVGPAGQTYSSTPPRIAFEDIGAADVAAGLIAYTGTDTLWNALTDFLLDPKVYRATTRTGTGEIYSPTAPGFAGAINNTIHAFRYATAIRGGHPSATSIRRGHTLTFTGSMWQQGTGPWTAMHGATVALMYKPAGSTRWYVATTTRTTTSGSFSLYARDTRNATWAVVYITPDNRHIDAVGPQTYVHVH